MNSTTAAKNPTIEERLRALEERVRYLELVLLQRAYPDPKPWPPYPYVPYYPDGRFWVTGLSDAQIWN